MDVLVRAVNAALFVSHGIRRDTDIILHLCGGPGPDRRILFNGETLSGVRPDERSIARQIKAILKRPVPAIGLRDEVTQGIFDIGGGLQETLTEWKEEGVSTYVLDAQGEGMETIAKNSPLGFVLSDHQSFTEAENQLNTSLTKISLGNQWLQGHACITIVQHTLDN